MRTNYAFRAMLLGVLNGAIYSAVQFLLVAAYFDYRIQEKAAIAEEMGLPPMQSISLFNSRIVSIWFILFFAITSMLAHQYLSRLKRHPVLFWEAIGLAAVVEWNVVVLTVFWISSRLTGQTASFDLVTTPTNPLFGPFSLGLVIITNFIYGAVITATSKRRADHDHDHRLVQT